MQKDPKDDTQPGSTPVSSRKPRDRYYLIVLSGHSMGNVVRLEDSATLGRGAEADIRILDTGVSRLHSQFVIDRAVVRVRDLGSRNGTYVNGERITEQELVDGDEVEIGVGTTIRVSAFDAAEESFVRQLCESALLDPVTKAFNRRYFLDRMQREISYASRHSSALSMIVVDVEVSDAPLDVALQHIGSEIAGAVRHEDVVTRLEDRSFAVICRDMEATQLRQLASRVRERVAAQRYVVAGKGHSPVIAVCGAVRTSNIESVDAFLSIIHDARSLAKRQNRIVLAGDERRAHDRLDCAADVVIRAAGSLEWSPAKGRNIGVGGVAVDSPLPLTVGVEVEFAVLPVEEGQLVLGRVRHSDASGVVGIEFAEPIRPQLVELWAHRIGDPNLRLLIPAAETARLPDRPAPGAERPRLLIVDDEPALLNALKRTLKKYYDVVTTSRPLEALSWIEGGERYDIVLSDVEMPDLDGISLYSKISESAPEQAGRMCFMTAGQGIREIDDFLELLNRPAVTKPFQIDDLLATLAHFSKR